MSVNSSALDGHIGHGDTLGSCSGAGTVIPSCSEDNGKTITLSAGTYYMDDVSLDDYVTINVTGPVQLHVNKLSIGNQAKINDGGNVKNLVIYVYNSFVVAHNAKVAAVIASPSASSSIVIGNSATLHGTVLTGGTALIGSNATVTFDRDVATTVGSIGIRFDGDDGYQVIGDWSEKMVQ
jgi:hypothetical protein